MYQRRRQALNATQVADLIAACPTARQKLVILALVEKGLHPNELSRLEKTDINWEEGSLRIPGRAAAVPASAAVVSLLREHFGTERKKVRLGVRQIQRLVRAVGHAAGLNTAVTPEVLQRTWLETSASATRFSGRKRERVLEAAADAAQDLILVADDERRFVDLNQAAAEVLGLRRDEVLGRRIDEFFSEAQVKPVPTAWSIFVVEGEQRGLCELRSGTPRTFEYRAKAHFRRGLHLSILREVATARSVENDGR